MHWFKKTKKRLDDWENNLPLEGKLFLGGVLLILVYLSFVLWFQTTPGM